MVEDNCENKVSLEEAMNNAAVSIVEEFRRSRIRKNVVLYFGDGNEDRFKKILDQTFGGSYRPYIFISQGDFETSGYNVSLTHFLETKGYRPNGLLDS